MTSHAAVVARGMGKCCVAGCQEIQVDEKAKTFKIKGMTLKELDYITLDGSTGEVFKGQLPLVEPELSGNFGKLMAWADEFRTLKIRTNADIPRDAIVGQFGIQPIMADIKAQVLPGDVMHSAFAERFRMLHGISSILYLVQSLLGAVLILKSKGNP